MAESSSSIITFPAETLPAALVTWIEAQTRGPLLVSFDRLPNGAWVLQSLPEIDPTMVARVRRILAEHADVLRRLT
ncbi:MAG: hypothetical protein NVS4B8_02000 [Herpetosiphon sp.]